MTSSMRVMNVDVSVVSGASCGFSECHLLELHSSNSGHSCS